MTMQERTNRLKVQAQLISTVIMWNFIYVKHGSSKDVSPWDENYTTQGPAVAALIYLFPRFRKKQQPGSNI